MSPSSGPQGGLFDEPGKQAETADSSRQQAPPGNCPDSQVSRRPPAEKQVGQASPGPDPVPRNACSSAIQIEDARRFVDWVHDQDISIHADVTVGHVLVGMSGFSPADLGWLCRAIRQAGHAPHPDTMRAALLKRDVGLLRPDPD